MRLDVKELKELIEKGKLDKDVNYDIYDNYNYQGIVY